MALIPFSVTVIDHVNNPNNTLANEPIEIRTTAGGNPLAIIFADEDGLIPIAQPGAVTDAYGVFNFYADSNSTYSYTATAAGRTKTLNGLSHNKLVGRNEKSAHDQIYRRKTTVLDLADGGYSDGDIVFLTDRNNEPFKIVAGGVANGWDILNAGVGFTAVHEDPEHASFKGFGVVADGITDDSDAFERWINQARNPVDVPGAIRLTRPITCSTPINWEVADPEATYIIPDLGTAGGKVIAFETDNVRVVGLGIDGSGLSDVLAANQYLLFAGDGVTKYRKHTYWNIKLINNTKKDALAVGTGLIVTHGIYVDNVDAVSIWNCDVDELSGAAVFVRDITGFYCGWNEINNSIWYPIHLVGGIENFEVEHNKISCDAASGIYWGGGIDLMSQHIPLETRNRNGSVHDNELSGLYSYGAVIRAFSMEDVDIYDNYLHDVAIGSADTGGVLTGIRLATRGTAPGNGNGPCHNIKIRNNKISAGLTGAAKLLAIYVNNDFQTTRNPFTNIHILENDIESPDSTHYWEAAVLCSGLAGGIEDLHVKNNKASVLAKASPIINGVIGFVATNAQGAISGVHIGGNRINDIGTPSASYQLGIGYGAFVDNVYQEAVNTIDNFFFGIRTFTDAGPILDRIDNNEYLNIGSSNDVYATGVRPSRFDRTLDAEKVFDCPSLAAGASAFTDVTVTGAVLGDYVQATLDVDNVLVSITGYVRTANSVRVLFTNTNTVSADPVSGNLKVKVYRY